MKKLCSMILCLLLVGTMALPVLAASDAPEITLQPQSPNWPEYSTALYTVKATGKNLSATWYLKWEGKTYNLSDFTNGFEPWEAYAGESYGPVQDDSNTFSCYFGGIEEELNGAEIWCVIEDGHYDVTSQKATVTVSGQAQPPQILAFPTDFTVFRGDLTELRCSATSNDGSQLTWLWYETATGKLQDIQAICDGPQYSDTWAVSSEQLGTRYYVCCVETDRGGRAYSNVVGVTVLDWDPEPEYPPDEPQVQEPVVAPEELPAQTEPETVPVTEPETVITTTPATAPAATLETLPETVPETAPASGEDASSGAPWWALVLIGVIAAATGVGVAVLLIMKKR